MCSLTIECVLLTASIALLLKLNMRLDLKPLLSVPSAAEVFQAYIHKSIGTELSLKSLVAASVDKLNKVTLI